MESSAEPVISTARCPSCHTNMLGSGTVVDQIEDRKIGREQWPQSLQPAFVSPFSLHSCSRFQVNVPTIRLAAASYFA